MSSQINYCRSAQDANYIPYEIVDDICGTRQWHCETTDSQSEPAGPAPRSAGAHGYVDIRLQYWKNMIRDRRALRRKLCLATGKQPMELLASQDYHDKQSFQRFLRERSHREDGAYTSSRLPLVGIPYRVGLEMECAVSAQREADLRGILEFYPHIRELELFGRNLWRRVPCERISGHTISSITPIEQSDRAVQSNKYNSESKAVKVIPSRLSVAINGTTYRLHRPEFSPIVERMFVCNPFEYSLRTVMRIENNGCEPISFDWARDEFFARNGSLFSRPEDVFVLDTEPFQLRPGELREVSVFFRPQKVGVIKQRWLLKTCPSIFFRNPYGVTLNIHGKCTPPVEYLERLNESRQSSLHSCRVNQTPVLIRPPKPYRNLCPYSRQLEDKEAFNQRNVSFHCDRDTELGDLRNFFYSLRPEGCTAEWDFSVSLLIELVCCKQDERQRIKLFQQLHSLLAPLRGRTTPLSLSDSWTKRQQRQRTRFIFVRGIIANGIEVWEERMIQLSAECQRKGCEKERRHGSKYLRDALYIYTYNQLSELAETIVSVIESTEHV